jgi:hypothetical protein
MEVMTKAEAKEATTRVQAKEITRLKVTFSTAIQKDPEETSSSGSFYNPGSLREYSAKKEFPKTFIIHLCPSAFFPQKLLRKSPPAK